jgi:hypothetical protein
MRVFRLALTACTLCVLADTAPVIAQDADRPDFVGTWILDLDASSFGPSPAPDSARIVVERADEHVVMVAQANVGDVDVTELWGIDSESGRLGIDRTIDVPGYGVFEQTLLYSKERE